MNTNIKLLVYYLCRMYSRFASGSFKSFRYAAVLAALVVPSIPATTYLESPTEQKQGKFYTSVPSKCNEIRDGLLGTIGNTPLIELKSLSEATGCRILAKAEFLNPGGSVKDRPAAYIILDAEEQGLLVPRHLREEGDIKVYTLVEATGGNTGVAMALIAASRGYNAVFTMPSNVSSEKVEQARTLGATVHICPLTSFDDPAHFYHEAERIAVEIPGSVLGSQFENRANFRAHFEGTGREIWDQTRGKLDAFVSSAGTGGTIGGVSSFLKSMNPDIKIFLVDPPGSGLGHYIETGTFDNTPKGSTITEGIGLMRITANFREVLKHIPSGKGQVLNCDNEETAAMAYFLLRNEGIWVGPSSALNVVGAVKAARALGPGHTIVTILCDGGPKYASKLFDEKWIKEQNLEAAKSQGCDLEQAKTLSFCKPSSSALSNN